jgi:hypothetical protein
MRRLHPENAQNKRAPQPAAIAPIRPCRPIRPMGASRPACIGQRGNKAAAAAAQATLLRERAAWKLK